MHETSFINRFAHSLLNMNRGNYGLARLASVFVGLTSILCGLLILSRLTLLALNLPVPGLPSLEIQDRGIALFDRNDRYLMTLHKHKDCQPIPIAKMSKNIINAVLAIEDHNFYHHCGIDLQSIMRAYRANSEAGQIVQGGSTITQQLVRNLYLDPKDRTYKRKIKEIVLACLLERQFNKDRILETYLNDVYFGNGVSGIQRASEFYFSKPASKLTVSEAAFLAGLIKAPSHFAVQNNRSKAVERQRIVLTKMLKYGFLTSEQAKSAEASKLAFKFGLRQREVYPYFISYLMQTLKQELGNEIWTKGWRVYTTLDKPVQELAQQTMNKEIRHAPPGINQGALVSMDVDSGSILAMVGGIGKFQSSQWNRAIHPHTAGSSFKPFVYLTGLTEGVLQPDTLINDAPLRIEAKGSPPYIPKNFDNKFSGWITVRDALAKSRNVCSIRVAQAVGIKNVIKTARAAGICSPLDPYPSLAVGACAVTPLEMTIAYSTFARAGAFLPAQIVRKIEHENGILYKTYAKAPKKEILSSEAVAELVDILQDVIKKGTGKAAQINGLQIAGKTGTADEAKDIWFIGFTPKVITTVWAGNDLNKRVQGKNVTGGVVMAGIWKKFMLGFNKIHPPVKAAFNPPKSMFANAVPRLRDSNFQIADMGELSDEARAYMVQKSEDDLKAMNKKGIAKASEMQKAIATKRIVTSAQAPPQTPTNPDQSTDSEQIDVPSTSDQSTEAQESATQTEVSQNSQSATVSPRKANGKSCDLFNWSHLFQGSSHLESSPAAQASSSSSAKVPVPRPEIMPPKALAPTQSELQQVEQLQSPNRAPDKETTRPIEIIVYPREPMSSKSPAAAPWNRNNTFVKKRYNYAPVLRSPLIEPNQETDPEENGQWWE